ncbi:MAG: hypothetical protein QNJ67_14630 [Kiloniellales bacterium]|nr:hypothetical protein [Kiloniellales bacterium]
MPKEIDPESAVPGQEPDRQHTKSETVARVRTAVSDLERAVMRLQHLSQRPGYEFIDRLLPGYVWAVEQAQELNETLAARAASRPERAD